MYWKKLTATQRGIGIVIVMVALVGLGLLEQEEAPEIDTGEVLGDGIGLSAADTGSAAMAGGGAAGRQRETPPADQLNFTDWSHGSGLFGTQVPRGWRVDGALGDAPVGEPPAVNENWTRLVPRGQ